MPDLDHLSLVWNCDYIHSHLNLTGNCFFETLTCMYKLYIRLAYSEVKVLLRGF